MKHAMREVKYLNKLRHPHVVHMHNVFKSDSGRVYVVLEHIDRTLASMLKQARPAPGERAASGGEQPGHSHGPGLDVVRSIGYQLLLAVDHMHTHKVGGGLGFRARSIGYQLLLAVDHMHTHKVGAG